MVNTIRSVVLSNPSVNACIVELKTRARLGLNALAAGDLTLLERAQSASRLKIPVPEHWQLRHALTLVSRSLGFSTWEQTRRVLGGLAEAGDDMGGFWHAPGCSSLLNHWYADYRSALERLQSRDGLVLFPYRRQFVVVGPPYLRELGLELPGGAGEDERMDLVSLYGSPIWLRLCLARLRASRLDAAAGATG